MKKLTLTVALLFNFFNYCFADEFDDTGIRNPLIKEREKLYHEDEREAYAEYVLLLLAAQTAKKRNETEWTTYFDAATQKLEEIQLKKSLKCRQLSFDAAEKMNFEKIWQERHSLGSVINNNLGEIAQASPLALLFAQSAHGLVKNIKMVTAVYDEAERMRNNTGFNVVAGALPGPNTGSIPVVQPIAYRLQIGRPTKGDVAKCTLVLYGSNYQPQKLADGEKLEALKFSAALAAAALGYSNPEFVHPAVAIAQHACGMALTANGMAPTVSKVWSEWGKKCPLQDIKNNLEYDQEYYGTKKEKEEGNSFKSDDFFGNYQLPNFIIPTTFPENLYSTEEEKGI